MPNTVEYYLSKRMDRRMASYFAAGRRTLTHVTPNLDYTLTLSFDNGEQRLYDMRPLIEPNTVFEFLGKWQNFQRVYLNDTPTVAWDIDPTVDSSIVWNNKVDLCPDSCYVDSIPLQNESVISS